MKLIFAAAVAVLLAAPARAEEKAAPAKSGWAGFFKNLKYQLSQSAVSGQQRRGKTATIVAAVRGKDQMKNIADLNEPSLKGDAKSARLKRDAALDKELSLSVEKFEKSNLEGVLKDLEAFKSEHPKHRAADVDQFIEGVKAQIAEKDVAAPAAPAAKE
jgi:hypothetical protein